VWAVTAWSPRERWLGAMKVLYKSVPFDIGDKVRILEKKEKFDKGKQFFCKELYTIDKGKDIN
jgi:hypothetical protein